MIVDTLYCAHRHRATLETQTARETETVYCTGTFFRRTGTGSTLRRWRAGNQSARSRRRRRPHPRPRPSERDTGLSIRCRTARMTGIFSALVVLKQDMLATFRSHRFLPASLPMASREDARHSAATSARSSTTLPRMHPLRLPDAPSACPGIVVTCPAIRSRLALRLGARIEAISGSLPKLVRSRRATLRGPRGRLAGIPLRLVPGGLRRGLCLLGRMALAVRSQAQHPLQSKRQASWSGRLKFETLTSMLRKP